MSKAEILDELPRLTAGDHSLSFARLAELHETDLMSSGELAAVERRTLDEALAELKRDQNPGEPSREAIRRIRDSNR